MTRRQTNNNKIVKNTTANATYTTWTKNVVELNQLKCAHFILVDLEHMSQKRNTMQNPHILAILKVPTNLKKINKAMSKCNNRKLYMLFNTAIQN